MRINRLDEADAYAIKSLEIGENINWLRNTAFCKKCLGRLRRIQAECSPKKSTKASLLKESQEFLLEAIRLFASNVAEYGPKHPEVGDCYSLLGRTFLAMGNVTDAKRLRTVGKQSSSGRHGEGLLGPPDLAGRHRAQEC